MYEIIKNVINNTDYKLEDILYKINKMYIESFITEEDKIELDNLARQKAKSENSYAPLQEQIDNIYEELDKIKEEIQEIKGEEEGETEQPVETEEYPEYVQPTGAHDAYHVGDKITYNGKKYICKLDNCVWTPNAYPADWEEVIEATEDNTQENEEVTEDTETSEEE